MDKKAIIYASYHHNNTYELFNEVLLESDCERFNILRNETKNLDLNNYDTIIFASGIYFMKMHKAILKYIQTNKELLKDKKLGVIITAGMKPKQFARRTSRYFKSLGLEDFPIFACHGFDTYGPLKLIGGANKGRPNEKDKEDLERFLRDNKILWD